MAHDDASAALTADGPELHVIPSSSETPLTVTADDWADTDSHSAPPPCREECVAIDHVETAERPRCVELIKVTATA